MKRTIDLRLILTGLMLFALLSPTVALAMGNGKKHFKQGMKHEAAEEWDKAAESFALAVNENPKNPEYRLHLRRALFNASQMYMAKGRTAAEQKDYEGAYTAFRKAFAYDPVNQLARSEMDRMLRLQEEAKKGGTAANGQVGFVPTSAQGTGTADFQMPQKLEKLRDLPFPSGVNLPFIIKQLAAELDLNVLFDRESNLETRMVRIELKNVTAAKALDYIFLQEGLFFQKVGPRTILVAATNRRTVLQQLVLRTFFLSNASPKDVKTVIQTAIPAQQGRAQTIVLEDASTNSITVRDTSENIALIAKLIQALDKDRAEVVMDVAIYEVNKNDLLQFGNQIGTAGSGGTLLNLGGVGVPFARRGSTGPITGGMDFPNIDVASIALGIPISTLAALQTKNDTKLLASTQIHAFNTEESSARIGQRVPVRTATFQTGNTNNSGVVSDVINYEQVGLTLKFTPTVFPNQDVQVKMLIESKDVSGASTLTPVFTERSITGTARIQNNRTLLLASVAQGVEARGRSGLPLLGLIPILGRLFTAPTRDNRQVDIVIAVTPRVIRAPAILPEDEAERPTGSVATPTSGSLEAMIIQEERDEYLASVRRNNTSAQVQLPNRPADTPVYVRNDAAEAVSAASPANNGGTAVDLKPIETAVKALQVTQTADSTDPAANRSALKPETDPISDQTGSRAVAEARFSIIGELPEMRAGEKYRIPVRIDATTGFRSAILGLKFDERSFAVRSVTYGDIFGPIVAGSLANPFLNRNGKMFVSLSIPEGESVMTGILAFVEIESLAAGRPTFEFETDVLNVMSSDGKNFAVKPEKK